ncbi:MAG TPA: adenylosuccinate synthetase [Gaiellaceae bacterium]
MRAKAVIGASFGDEGKGLTVDYLCSKGDAGVVVRFSGGAQAGHTVVTPEGDRHVFRSIGSGAFCGVPTFLSPFVSINPIALFLELRQLSELDVRPEIFASPECLVTTFADILINRRIEDSRGGSRHGSCGLGISETIERSNLPELRITMADLYNQTGLESKLAEICDKYARFRTGSAIDEPAMAEKFLKACKALPEVVFPAGIGQCKDPVFEGSQGLLLDQGNREYFPHVTRSHTGLKNVRTLCAQAGIDQIDAYYVSRTYLTRHGAGPLPGEDPTLSFEDDTNHQNTYQGALRFAPLDVNIWTRILQDAGDAAVRLVLTHRDQVERNDLEADLSSYGPSRKDVR